RAHEEQARAGQVLRHRGHRLQQVAPTAPGAHADLRDERVFAGEPELTPHGSSVGARVEALEVGAGVDHFHLLGGHAGGYQAVLDGAADGDDSVHTATRVADAAEAADLEADAAVEDEERAGAHEAREQCKCARAALVGVHDLDALGADETGQPPGRARAPLPAHGNGDVREPGATTARGPPLAAPPPHPP